MLDLIDLSLHFQEILLLVADYPQSRLLRGLAHRLQAHFELSLVNLDLFVLARFEILRLWCLLL
jgi:hypothetical protein